MGNLATWQLERYCTTWKLLLYGTLEKERQHMYAVL